MSKEDFIQLLKSHDWTYQFSDDPRVYKRGQRERDAINRGKAELGELGQQLYDIYNEAPRPDSILSAPRKQKPAVRVVCRNTGNLGEIVDKTPNGFLEVAFKGVYGIKYVRQSDVIKLD